jgi:hypothetical protein
MTDAVYIVVAWQEGECTSEVYEVLFDEARALADYREEEARVLSLRLRMKPATWGKEIQRWVRGPEAFVLDPAWPESAT